MTGRTLLVAILPLALSTGCELDALSSTEAALAVGNGDFGVNRCGQSLQSWIDAEDWPLDSVAAGDMVFTKGDLVEYMDDHPGDRSALIGDMAALQLNMSIGLIVPDLVLDRLIAADDWVMAPKGDRVPPLVNIEDYQLIGDYNSYLERQCYTTFATEVEATPGTLDLRDDIVAPVPGVEDLRTDLVAER